MLIALWQYDKEELLAGLLIFRLLYYILPFALALAVLGIREVMLAPGEAARCRRSMTAARAAARARLAGPAAAARAATDRAAALCRAALPPSSSAAAGHRHSSMP